ncbi:hypothetical protein FA13DRAFT_1724234 [Coprinellus micaceus]|uniref:Uncharacterized protein n=1 Tax=Coprinellus micaceus TaxID=71717 RepID=A0A4Y7U0R3_COPMI|nr:hypothetical protein FA13DRAFT_1724234 [Coprinellus micaceus]
MHTPALVQIVILWDSARPLYTAQPFFLALRRIVVADFLRKSPRNGCQRARMFSRTEST